MKSLKRRPVRLALGIAASATMAVATTILGGIVPASAATHTAPAAAQTRSVVLVGNSFSGTVSFLDGNTFQNLGTLNVAADKQQRIDAMDPIAAIGHIATVALDGGEHLADDLYTSPDGTKLYVSRGTLDDVVAYDLTTGQQIWRHVVSGFKADHAVLSPDGTRFIVSATTASVAEVLDTATGAKVTEFKTGTYPHSNDYSADGKYIYNSSIGTTSLPQILNGFKGDKLLTVVDAKTFAVVKTYKFDYGIRPSVITPDGKTMYAQLSYLNGFVKYDLTTGKIVKTVNMPFSTAGKALKPDDYPQNSAHHGMAVSGDGTKLCEIGTIDDYAAIVRTSDLGTQSTKNYDAGSLPYWSTTSADGKSCLVSLANKDQISVINYATGAQTALVSVGDYPQRTRLGKLAPTALRSIGGTA
jgi:DNA-binding beta-propeller fold protein YncE